MKLSTTLALAGVTAGIAAAQPHGHQHHHVLGIKRDVTVTESVPGPTVVAYELDGLVVELDEVCAGIASGNLKPADGHHPIDCSTTSATPSSVLETLSSSINPTFAPAATTEPASNSDATYKFNKALSSSEVASAETPASATSTAATATSASSSNSPASSSSYGGSGLDTPFPDGEHDCSVFPSEYGAIYIDYLELEGWIGLQDVSSLVKIVGGVAGQGCAEGWMCSYACPPGYQKSQWPINKQGALGQSVGGLHCRDGKLHLTNPDLSRNLCIRGTGGVQAQNNAGSVVSICRTDYPGSEGQTVPTVLQPGVTEELTCPDEENYYNWEGKPTSAQYYLNPSGYDASQACRWGTSAKPIGNWAPLNLGVGSRGGTTWLSIFANNPTTDVPYNGTVEIKGDISGSCKYENGQFHPATESDGRGCTVSVTSGEATFVIS